MITIVSGPIGAGKTTVARLLLERLGKGVAYIEGDAFWPPNTSSTVSRLDGSSS